MNINELLSFEDLQDAKIELNATFVEAVVDFATKQESINSAVIEQLGQLKTILQSMEARLYKIEQQIISDLDIVGSWRLN